MRDAFRFLTALLFAAAVVQAALARHGASNTVDRSDDDGSITKDALENGFTAHVRRREAAATAPA
jgi:hypothetical protein